MINKETAYNKINAHLLEMEKEVGLKLKINDEYFCDFYDFMFLCFLYITPMNILPMVTILMP